ncbi:SCAR-like protein [Trifolium medium]|uniref:SCAR-like protein n=1 Tax=Trifolium medium TaxID=97028 RepID=A0A392NLV3_9FABA|nr:SCAR-like protein [Trifolium medium]
MSHSHAEPTRPPPPPPIPPTQWKVAKPQLDKSNETQNSMSEDAKHLGPQKLNGHKQANNQLRMGKEMDEREDFLYQIRTKSFNLRPTVTGKSNATAGPTTNVKVTAILEKANAIRQVVASDDGEDDDDNWSDT